MRNPGETVIIPQETLDFCKKMYPNKNEEQQRGFALDIVEKFLYQTCFEGWHESEMFAPYDVRGDSEVHGQEIYVDFKLCSRKTVTISNNECEFAENIPGYYLFIYHLDKNPNVAVFRGGISYEDIKPHLIPSQYGNTKYAWLSKIQHLIA